MITGRTVLGLGLSQLILWGITYYLIGGFGDAMTADLGASRDAVYGGFSAALLVMALASPLAGRWIDRHGGRRVMAAGSVLTAAGCLALAASHRLATYYAAWLALGVAMRLTLYDAAFAALAGIAGAGARRAMAQITLLGGLASTVFWPFGRALADRIGWRGAVGVYAGFALLTVPLHLALPDVRRGPDAAASPAAGPRPLATRRSDRILASALYAATAALAAFLNAGMSSHMIGLLTGLGVAASAVVWIAALRGVGQSAARFGEVVFGRRIDPLTLNLAAAALLPACFVAGLFSGRSTAAAAGFALVYGASNGILTITRGTLPLVLFDPRVYGAFVGRLLVPSFALSAAGPVIYASVIQRLGDASALGMSLVAAGLVLIAAVVLQLRFRGRERSVTPP